MTKVWIAPGCLTARDANVGGLPRKIRLQKSLEKTGCHIVEKPALADRQIPDCIVPVGDEMLHLCEVGTNVVEDRLLESLKKPADGLIARWINRRISLTITRQLMNTRVHPHLISILTMTLGIFSGVLVAQGTYLTGILGALLLQFQSILDGVDGELARLKFQTSRIGQWLDTVSDDLTQLSFLIGLTIHETNSAIQGVGRIGILAFLMTESLLYFVLATRYHSGDLLAFQWDLGKSRGWVQRLKFLFKHDFLCLLCVVLAMVSQLRIALLLISAGKLIVLATLTRQLTRWGFSPPPTPPQ